jgi:hypothetical protein
MVVMYRKRRLLEGASLHFRQKSGKFVSGSQPGPLGISY